jgi:hypothetical protein
MVTSGKGKTAKLSGIGFLVLATLLVAIVVPVEARVGLAITPSSGDYFIKKGGGTIDFLVSNYGDEQTVFSIRISDEATQFATLDKFEATIPPGGSEKFSVFLSPASAAEYGRAYPLTVTATAQASSGAPGLVSSNIRVFFRNEAGRSDYTTSAKVSLPTAEGLLAGRLFTLFAAIVLVGIAYYLIKTRGPWKE